MADLFLLLKIMILGKWLILTPLPITLDSSITSIDFEEPVKAVSSGAHIRLDVSDVINEVDFEKKSEKVAKEFSDGCIRVVLVSEDQSMVMNKQGTSFGKEKIVHLQFFHEGGLSTEDQFTAVRISSCKPIKNVSVIWANYYM